MKKKINIQFLIITLLGDTDNGIAFYLCILRIIQAGSDGRLKNEHTASG